jgi:dolichol-phosphate mannosyltransferase
MRTIVVIPTYNERDNLEELTARIWQHADDAHILVVDDNSPDGTGELADTLSQAHPGRFFVLHRARKEGLGPAYVAGFAASLERDYETILQMDGDLSHAPCFLPALRERGRRCDLVVGSRYVQGINVVNWDFKRLLLSKLASQYARFVLRLPVTDPTSGFKCWRSSALRALQLQQAVANGYLFQIETTYKALRSGATIEELPIIFYERKLGSSKMNWSIIFEAIFGVLRLRFFPSSGPTSL